MNSTPFTISVVPRNWGAPMLGGEFPNSWELIA